MSSKTRNGATETTDTATEVLDKEVESAVDTLLEVGAIVDAALTNDSSETTMPDADVITEALEAEEERPSRRGRRIVRGGSIVLITAAFAIAAGIALAMLLRRRGPDEESVEDLLA